MRFVPGMLLMIFGISATGAAPSKPPAASQPARPRAVVLKAADAVLHGHVLKLKYEKRTEISYWTDPKAYVEWQMKLPHPGKYEVELVMACEEGRGGEFIVSAGDQTLKGKTRVTKGPHHYIRLSIGTLDIAHPDAALTIKPAGAIRGSLMSLRAVRLIPVKES
jgi:hypothetical protein